MAVVIPIKIKREIELIDQGVPRVRNEKSKLTRSELILKALSIVTLLNEIASTYPISNFLEKHVDIMIMSRAWNVILTRRLGSPPRCAARLDIDGSSSEYSRLSAKIDFQFWSDTDLIVFTNLDEKKIKKIILDWLRAYREHLPDSYR